MEKKNLLISINFFKDIRTFSSFLLDFVGTLLIFRKKYA